MTITHQTKITEGSPEFHAKKAEIFENLIERYAYVLSTNRIVLREDPRGESFSEASWNKLNEQYHYLEYVDNNGALTIWSPTLKEIQDVRQYMVRFNIKNIDFKPGSEQVVKDKHGHDCLNLWSPVDLPQKDRYEHPQWFFDYLDHLTSANPKEQLKIKNHIIGFLAHLVQHPEDKVLHALLITSKEQGVGKSTLSEIAQRLVNPSCHFPLNPTSMKTQFNAWMAGKTLITIDELYAEGNRALANQMKEKITAPTVSMEAKGKDPVIVGNYTRFICFSNKSAPLPIEDTDRRYFVYDCTGLKVRPREWWNKIYHHILYDDSKSGLADLHHHLMSVDYRALGFDPKLPPPETISKRNLIGESEEEYVQYLRDLILSGELSDELGISESYISLQGIREILTRAGFRDIKRQLLTEKMRKLGFTEYRVPGKGNKVWVIPTIKEIEAMTIDKHETVETPEVISDGNSEYTPEELKLITKLQEMGAPPEYIQDQINLKRNPVVIPEEDEEEDVLDSLIEVSPFPNEDDNTEVDSVDVTSDDDWDF